MEKTDKRYQAYIDILREELIPAMGCTEPIAVAYAAAAARNTLGELPDKVLVEASGSMIKNVKSVIVPNTDNMKGLEAAAAAGADPLQPDHHPRKDPHWPPVCLLRCHQRGRWCGCRYRLSLRW